MPKGQPDPYWSIVAELVTGDVGMVMLADFGERVLSRDWTAESRQAYAAAWDRREAHEQAKGTGR